MTVAELIVALEKLPGTLQVEVESLDSDGRFTQLRAVPGPKGHYYRELDGCPVTKVETNMGRYERQPCVMLTIQEPTA